MRIQNMQKKVIPGVTLAVLALLSAAMPVLGADYAPMSGTYQFTEDTTITIPLNDSAESAIKVDSGQQVTTDGTAGLEVTLKDHPLNNGKYGIYAINGGSVTLSDVKVVTEGPFNIGAYAYNGGTIAIGDNSSISGDVQAALLATGTGSNITVGKNAELYGNIWGGNSAVVYASSNGNIEIGSGARIYNTPATGSSNLSQHRAIHANGGTVSVGDDSIISTVGSGPYGYGVLAGEMTPGGASGTVILGDRVKIETSGFNSNAMMAYGNGALVTIGVSSDISTEGERAYAVHAAEGGRVDVGAGSVLSTTNTAFTGTNTTAQTHAILAQNSGSIVNIGESSEISTKGGNSLGIYADTGSTVNVSDCVSITTEGSAAYGVQVAGSAKVNMGDGFTFIGTGDRARGINVASTGGTVTVGNGARILTEGANGHGIYALGTGTNVTIGDNLYITMQGDNSYGLTSGNGANITVGENTTILASGDNAKGAYASNGTLVVGENAEIRTFGSRGDALYAENGGALSVGEGSLVETMGDQALAIYTSGSGSKIETGKGVTLATTGDNSHSVYATTSTDIILGDQNRISTTADNSYTLVAVGTGAKISVGAGSEIKTSGTSADAVVAFAGGQIDLFGAKIEALGAGSSALYALGASATAESVISGTGIFDIAGDIVADYYSDINLTMTDGSFFIGSTFASSGDITLDLAGTQWELTGSSDVTKLTMGNGTNINLSNAAFGTELHLGSLTTKNPSDADTYGMFTFKTDIVNETAGKLIVNGTTEGYHKVSVLNDGSQETTGDERVMLIETADKGGSFALTHIVELGAFQYDLRDNNDGNGRYDDVNGGNGQYWELYRSGTATSGGSSNAASAAINTFVANYLLNYAETNTLIQRLGDLRDTPNNQGAWFRAYGGKFKSNSRSFTKDFDMDYGGVQAGYDRKLEKSWFTNGDTYLGAFLGYSKGDLDYKDNGHGSGNAENKTLGAYATYVADNGFFVDAIVRYVWSTNDFNVHDSAGVLVVGDDVDLGGFGASLEIGRRFRFEPNATGGRWYVEPQAQLSYLHQGGATFNDITNGLRIGIDSFNSLLGRLGFLFGYETDKTNFYAKVSYVKEFDGDMDIRYASGTHIASQSFDDSWWVYGVGITHQVNLRNSLYVSLERSSGGIFTEDWSIRGGWRVIF